MTYLSEPGIVAERVGEAARLQLRQEKDYQQQTNCKHKIRKVEPRYSQRLIPAIARGRHSCREDGDNTIQDGKN